MSRGPAALLAVVVAVSAVAGTGAATTPSGAPASGAAGTLVPVVGVSAVCPALRSVPGRASTVSVAAVPGVAGQASGQVTGAALSAGSAPGVLPVDGAGQAVRGLFGDVADDAVVVRATGGLAGGLDVEERDRNEGGRARGLASVRCGPPTAESWFVGGSQGAGQQSYLFLVNPEDESALVDVRLWSAEGAVDPRPGAGLVVEPRSRLAVRVDRLAPGATALAGQVLATRGRVFAAVLQTAVDGRAARGVEWAAPSPPPAARVTVAGLPQGPGARRVQVTNPGEEPTTVRLRVSSGDGQFVPAGEEAVPVPAGTTVVRDLTEEAAGSPLSVEVLSQDAPVIAAGQAVDTTRGQPSSDFSWSAPGVPLSGPALVADAAVTATSRPTLLLAAPAEDGRVVLTPVALAGGAKEPPRSRTVAVAGGSALAVPLSQVVGTAGPYALEVRPADGSGPVLATLHLAERAAGGPRTTTRVLQAALPPVLRPAVQGDPAVAGGG